MRFVGVLGGLADLVTTPLCVSQTSLAWRCLWVYRMKNERPIGLVDLLAGLTVRIFLHCVLRLCAALDDLAVLVCYLNRCQQLKKIIKYYLKRQRVHKCLLGAKC